eukprot:Skav220538  [mRNA]  locus=scaffold1683:53028:56958:- [translate_table: standard]
MITCESLEKPRSAVWNFCFVPTEGLGSDRLCQKSRQVMAEKDIEYPDIPPFAQREQRETSGKGVPWGDLPRITVTEINTCLCQNLFDMTRQQPIKKAKCPHGHSCTFAHSFRKDLRAPMGAWESMPGKQVQGYKLNSPMPEGAPKYLTRFEADDWGSNHANNPIFEFAFEETYPTKCTRFMEMIVAGKEKNPWLIKHGPRPPVHPPWSATQGRLCYHWTLKDNKCSHWMNCNFLHVRPEALQREFKRHGCRCRNGRPCQYKGCMFAHRPIELRYPDEFTTSGFPENQDMKTIVFVSSTGIEETFEISKVYLADTFSKDYGRLCQDQWCVDAECRKGVHLLPGAWMEKAFRDLSGQEPAPPDYFKRDFKVKVQRPSPQRPRKPSAWQTPDVSLISIAARPEAKPQSEKAPEVAEAPEVAQKHQEENKKENEKENKMDAVNAEREQKGAQGVPGAQGPQGPQGAQEAQEAPASENVQKVDPKERVPCGVPHKTPNPPPSEASEAQDPDPEAGDFEDAVAFDCMLEMPPPTFENPWAEPDEDEDREQWEEDRKSLQEICKEFSDKDQETLIGSWEGGLSKRYREMYSAWLQSREMHPRYKKDGYNVYYHPDLIIGRGQFAKVFLGMTASDGQEVALKIYGNDQKKFSRDHFTKEVKQMKEHSMIPGVVKYSTSFVHNFKDLNTGVNKKQPVVILELMEGSLAEAMTTWKSSEPCNVGKLPHLQVIRYVSGSLLSTLSGLNPASSTMEERGLVHRDVKPQNILVDRNNCIRLADFGISKTIEKKQRAATASTASPGESAFASPEAKSPPFKAMGSVYVMATSDLFSLGCVIVSMLRVAPEGENVELQVREDEIPSSWPKHHGFALQQLVEELRKVDPSERAFARSLGAMIDLHRIVASHPFFWNARRSLHFLITLGNYKFPGPFGSVLVDAVACSINECDKNKCLPGETWFDKVKDMEQKEFPTKQKYKDSPFGLLKFIRNKSIQMADRGMQKDIYDMLSKQPEFLNRFPKLVINCWTALLEVLTTAIVNHVSHAQLLEFFDRPFEPGSLRRWRDYRDLGLPDPPRHDLEAWFKVGSVDY